jgi:hypothetical protein
VNGARNRSLSNLEVCALASSFLVAVADSAGMLSRSDGVVITKRVLRAVAKLPEAEREALLGWARDLP